MCSSHAMFLWTISNYKNAKTHLNTLKSDSIQCYLDQEASSLMFMILIFYCLNINNQTGLHLSSDNNTHKINKIRFEKPHSNVNSKFSQFVTYRSNASAEAHEMHFISGVISFSLKKRGWISRLTPNQ